MARRIGMKSFLAAVIIAVSGSAASAIDKVITVSGKIYVGTVLSESRRFVVIDTKINNISTRLTIPRHEVSRIIRDVPGEVPATGGVDSLAGGDAVATLPGKAEDAEKVVAKRDGYALVMEVPIEGTFGEEVWPKGIEESLVWATEHGVTDVVFRINSPGGKVWVADAIQEVMDRHRDELRYHALIESAISAAIWPSFMCDTISMAPGGTVGGAVVYTINANTGSAEVDKKMNSIRASQLAASAAEQGHSPAVVKAMMVSDYELWAVPDETEESGWALVGGQSEAPARVRDRMVQIDGPQQVLTLTSIDAVKYGIGARLGGSSLEDLATAQGLGAWDDAGDVGPELVEEWAEDSAALLKDLQSTVEM